MGERYEPKPPRMELKGKKLAETEMSLEEIKRHPTVHVSPRGATTTTMTATKQPSSGAKWNCLCSPTTHAGSFRCRYHRIAGMARRGSLESNLSLLDNPKPQPITDSLQAQSSF